MSSIKPLYTATAEATGGRNGHSEAIDHSLSVNLSVPKEMGGAGLPDSTTPEHLFACGYAACFGGALDLVGKQHHVDATKARIKCSVSIGPRDAGGFGIAVKMTITDKDVPQKQLEELVKETHEKVCPYSNAVRGNVAVDIEIIGG